jgi:predicted molibdopterin-dependent oxidoreductase YjgC
VEPTGAARPEWEVLNELVFNGSGGPVSIEGLFNAMAQETPALAGVTWASLGDQGVTIDL